MITISAFKWVPDFARGQVRDHRVRWILNEVDWSYKVRLIDGPTQQKDWYRALQPFGQVPIMEEDGRPTLFESGAILLDVATRANALLPADEGQRSLAICWLFAALNSIEPYFANLDEVDFFLEDEAQKAARRPLVLEGVHTRLEQLSSALGSREYLAGDAFSIADLAVSSVLKLLRHTTLVEEYPNVAALRDRCFARPAYRKAVADQCAEIDRHSPSDMMAEAS